jgi:hypothetical protein
MNKTSTDKIRLATPFLVWFRRCLPQPLQAQVRPYLDRPYRLALTILDRCDSPQPVRVKEIAQLAEVAPQTAQQVLLALKEGGMKFAVSPTHGWQSSGAEPMRPEPNGAASEETSCLNGDCHPLERLLPIASHINS